jgi:hypothetical protein
MHHILGDEQEAHLAELRTAALINLADLICVQLGIGYKQPVNGFSLSETESAKYFAIDEKRLEDFVSKTDSAFHESKDVFL